MNLTRKTRQLLDGQSANLIRQWATENDCAADDENMESLVEKFNSEKVKTLSRLHIGNYEGILGPIRRVSQRSLIGKIPRVLNAYPSHGNGYENIPPTEIFRGTKLDHCIDFPLSYGDVCLVPSDVPEHESKTSMARGEIAITMLPHGNPSADITFMNTRAI